MPDKITPCPEGSMKCVSTLNAQGYGAMDAIDVTASVEEVMAAVDAVVAEHPRTTVVEREPHYLKAVFRTKVIRFKDTVEFEVDPERGQLHFRSESVPYAGSDLGANRKRMTQVRAMLVERLG